MNVAATLSRRDYDVVLFDLDGVLTRTARVHAAAWKRLFDSPIEQRANVSSSNAGEVERAFKNGVPHLGAKADALQFLPREASGLEQLDTALDRLAMAAPQLKKKVIEACAHVVSADGVIQEREAELLRAIADTLDCPIPPFVEIAARAER